MPHWVKRAAKNHHPLQTKLSDQRGQSSQLIYSLVIICHMALWPWAQMLLHIIFLEKIRGGGRLFRGGGRGSKFTWHCLIHIATLASSRENTEKRRKQMEGVMREKVRGTVTFHCKYSIHIANPVTKDRASSEEVGMGWQMNEWGGGDRVVRCDVQWPEHLDTVNLRSFEWEQRYKLSFAIGSVSGKTWGQQINQVHKKIHAVGRRRQYRGTLRSWLHNRAKCLLVLTYF